MKQRISSQKDIKSLGTILGVWAHPDDEIFSMAGIMASALRNGQRIIIVTATRGEAGVQDESRWPAAHLGDIRTRELEAAYRVLGEIEHHWLDYPDGGCKEVIVSAPISCIAELIETYEPDSIFTFGIDGMTGHDDHKTVSLWTEKACKISKSTARVYHAIQTHDQYKHMQEADKKLNVFFNIDKPKTHKEYDCDIHYRLPLDIFNLKLKALEAMPSQTEAMLQKFHNILPNSLGVEAFVKA